MIIYMNTFFLTVGVQSVKTLIGEDLSSRCIITCYILHLFTQSDCVRHVNKFIVIVPSVKWNERVFSTRCQFFHMY